jgi:predicted secreted protein
VKDVVRAQVGSQFEICLEAAATAGYKWDIEMPPEAAGTIRLLGVEWKGKAGPSMGGKTDQCFHFHAEAAGEIPLQFTYRRSWQPSSKDGKIIVVDVAPVD